MEKLNIEIGFLPETEDASMSRAFIMVSGKLNSTGEVFTTKTALPFTLEELENNLIQPDIADIIGKYSGDTIAHFLKEVAEKEGK